MCITSSDAVLSNTKILSLKLDNGNHLLAYSNTVENISGKPNSLILAVPGIVKKEYFYDTSKYNNFLNDIVYSLTLGDELTRGIKSKSKHINIDLFEIGQYTCLIAKNSEEIKQALNVLPDNKRPEIEDELIQFFSDHYKGWSLVLCCFDEDAEMTTQPIMFEYTPFNYDVVYFPTMDSHTGESPDLTEYVEVDHSLITNGKYNVRFSQEEYFPDSLKGVKTFDLNTIHATLENGDFYIVNDQLMRTLYYPVKQ